MSAALEHLIGPNTVDDWLAAEPPTDGTRLELILGYFHVSPAPSGQHQYAGDEIRAAIRGAIGQAGRTDLYVVTGVGVKISSLWRMALIPDVAVLGTKPIGTSFSPEDLLLAVEVWSPGNKRNERETKMIAYASAGVPYVWCVDEAADGVALRAYRLVNNKYVEETTARTGNPATITAAPVPVTLDPADLLP